ncbi:MAG: hypothetical protein KAS36_14655 [Anaerolineales bacterium]|nr:hypothetical protein [Anaerolineales bacterium]
MRDFLKWLNKLMRDDLRPALREFGKWLVMFAELFLEGCEQIANWFFGVSRWMGILRWLLITVVGAGLWAILAYGARDKASTTIDNGLAVAQVRYVACNMRSALTSNPQKFSRENRCYNYKIARSYTLDPLIFQLPFKILFAPGILRHVLLIGFAVWMAFKIAALYQSRIYDLAETSSAEHFILQAALINPYNLINIQDGKVNTNDKNSPLFLIGGPGKVSVHSENAALFEKMDGEPHIIRPTERDEAYVARLDGFERLRSIVDLRDQKERFDIPGRTQDGIRIKAIDMQVVYSIYRDHQEPTYEKPYPFQDPEAVENLVYHQGQGPWYISIAVLIRGELHDFFANHRLDEFLGMVDKPEWKKKQQQERQLKAERDRLMGVAAPLNPPPFGSYPGNDFVYRPMITDKFYTASQQLRSALGVQINWIGVGTWDFPVQVFSNRHQDAWRITRDNQALGDPVVLKKLRNERRLGEILRLVQAVPVTTFKSLKDQGTPKDEILRGLIRAYYQQMDEALEDYKRVLMLVAQGIANTKDPVKRIKLQDEQSRLEKEKGKLEEALDFLVRFV